MSPPLRVAFDVTALLEVRTGVGTVVGELARRLAARDDISLVAYALSWKGRHRVSGVVPAGAVRARGGLAARPLMTCWERGDFPPITFWTGPVDLVHGPNYVVPPAPAAQLVTVHDLTPLRFPELCDGVQRRFPTFVARALRRGGHVHTVSRFVADEVVGLLGADPSRVHVVPNGVGPVAAGDAGAGRRRAGAERYVLALSTIEPRKDFPSLVAAFDAVAADDPGLHLVVAGRDGWGTDAFDAAVAAARHRGRVVRLGYVDDGDRADLLAGAAVFAYPSLYEGFGLPPLEAMQAGVPVIATWAGALPEVLGDAAVLVDPGNVDALAGALSTVLGDESRARSLVARGRERAGRYSWDSSADQMADLYHAVAGSRGN
ncbi:MAG: glycosyltransferase family 4 protein [Acidimicrobiia bacterium]